MGLKSQALTRTVVKVEKFPNKFRNVIWARCPICNNGTLAPLTIVPKIRDHRGLSFQQADVDPFYNNREQMGIVCGKHGSGKTVLLDGFAGWFYSDSIHHTTKGRTLWTPHWEKSSAGGFRIVCPSNYGKGYKVIFRVLSRSLEALSLCDVFPCRLFIPEGADIELKKPIEPLDFGTSRVENPLEKHHFKIRDFDEIIQHSKKDKINLIATDVFLKDSRQYDWWEKYLDQLTLEKQMHLKDDWLLIWDEFKDLAPAKGGTTTSEQRWIANRIRRWLDFFRKSGIKTIVTTHDMNEIEVHLRRNVFGYWYLKKSDQKSVPDRFSKYGKKIEKFWKTEMWVKDDDGHFSVKPHPYFMLPRQIEFIPIIPKYLQEEAMDEGQKSTFRVAHAIYFGLMKGFKCKCAFCQNKKEPHYIKLSFRDLVDLLAYNSVGGIQQVKKQYSLQRIEESLGLRFDPAGLTTQSVGRPKTTVEESEEKESETVDDLS